ncbi:MAG: phage capsid protein [Anaerolineae bacterium]
MATPQVDVQAKVAFASSIAIQAQQTESKLQATVDFESLEGEKKFFDDYGSVSLVERTVRSQEVTYQEVPRGRRMITPQRFEYAEIFEPGIDDIRLMRSVAPDSALTKVINNAFNRKKDETIITAFDGTAYSGKNGTTAVVWGTDEGTDVAVGGALQSSHLITTRETLLTADVEGPFTFACHPSVISDLLVDTNVTSADYNVVRTLVTGEVDSFMGFRFVTSTLLTTSTAFAYASDSTVFGMDGNVEVSIDRIPERGNSTQILVLATMAATRRFGNKIVRLTGIA